MYQVPPLIGTYFRFTFASLQLIRDVGITHGDETRVGYYVGLMVCSMYSPYVTQ